MAEKFFEKQPQEIKPFDVDFADKLFPEETIISVVITIFDSNGDDISSTILNGAATITTGKSDINTKIIQQVKAGTDGDDYWIEVLATASDGSKPEVDVQLRIRKKGYR